MKKLIVAALIAGSMTAVAADETVKPTVAVPVAATNAVRAATPEQRAERRAKFIAERKAAMEARAVEVIKKYGLDDEKAKALFNDLQQAMRAGMGRRPMPNKRPTMKKPASAPAE